MLFSSHENLARGAEVLFYLVARGYAPCRRPLLWAPRRERWGIVLVYKKESIRKALPEKSEMTPGRAKVVPNGTQRGHFGAF